ncbi:MAG: 4Fe-4S binding protein [Xanthomonadales bacterium]|nr:2-oxoacid:acceptor oxidoreductase family protein [Gammaproteobacteria bacterium]MBT8055163.1 2-oxoacid:acceptor oxidoreductase family protein [Gammaproteobacteria bacterium]NND57726.1 4Fe-4S binding protein [Xanthomonadales bacterium]NNK52835.1 4Fe-4S binding protein [Xanthomonadales bacterium]
MNECVLPDPTGFFEIRFESIGGLGAHAAGQILARAAVLKLNLNGSHFSSYGSEKKGSVVRSYVRLGDTDKPIRTSAPIDSPDALVVFHGALLEQEITIAGMKNSGTLIYNGCEGEVPELLKNVPAGARIIRIDATNIAIEELSRPNAVLLGALTAAAPFLDADTVLETLTEKFAKRNPQAAASNERAYRRGASEYEVLEGVGEGSGDLPAMRPSPVLGYETAPIGGVIPYAGNTVSNDLSASRTGWMPLFTDEECVHCGLCATVCPDFCLVWTHEQLNGEESKVRLKGIDYQYCKGCMRCIETCPTEAMTRVTETPGLADELRVPLFVAGNPGS